MERQKVVESLQGWRREWQEAAQGEPLIQVKADIGLVMVDVCALLELTQDETQQVLGSELYEKAEEAIGWQHAPQLALLPV
jgi:hypothetical protein